MCAICQHLDPQLRGLKGAARLKGLLYRLCTHALQALFLGGTAFGGLMGGWIGDVAARFYPNHGRITATQFSVAAGVPFSLLLLKVRASRKPAAIHQSKHTGPAA